MNWQSINATRTVVIAFAILCGLSGITAGVFELQQGNVVPDSFIISTIGPEYSMWRTYDFSELQETYSALTIIPNFFVTGILAIIVSSIGIVWALWFIQNKYGAIIYFVISIIQVLVGGSFVLDLAIINALIATRINQPLKWWRSHLSEPLIRFFSMIWPGSMLLFTILSIVLLGIPVLALIDAGLLGYMGIASALMFIPIILMIIGGFAYDIQRKPDR
jgi:hypothetical protein